MSRQETEKHEELAELSGKERDACESPPEPEAKECSPGKSPKKTKNVKVPEEELKTLREKAALADEYYDRLLRLQADFENFRKRKERERLDVINYATERLVCELVPVLSNFEMALAAAEKLPHVQGFVEGVELILKQLKKVLTEHGVEEICPIQSPFDPYRHEAVEKVLTDEHPEGHVLEVLRTGYALNDRVLLPAAVKVATAATEKSGTSSPGEKDNAEKQPETEASPDRPEEGNTTWQK
jgi:molecular chaperone GrpE